MEAIRTASEKPSIVYMPKNLATRKIFSKDRKSVADEFNEFFATVGENTTKKIDMKHCETTTGFHRCLIKASSVGKI
jgi:hypothetical protein